jgi:hypothetical protein
MVEGFTLEDMSMVIELPDEMVRRLEPVAAARGETIEAAALEALDVSPLLIEPVVSVEVPRRRRLAFVGIGSSHGGISPRIDELLADGFGRDT